MLNIISLTPAQLRTAARALDVGPDYHATATEIRDIADRLERGETVTVDRPAYQVSYMNLDLPPSN